MLKQIANKKQLFSSSLAFSIRSKHALPVLDYPVEQGIQPCITPKQLDFHYNKHHKTYVDKLNQLVAGTPFENMPLDQIIVKTAFDPKSVPVFNNAAQHFNHSFYWKCLRPKPSQAEAIPTTIKQKIEQTWGSFEKFQAEFTEKTIGVFGSGWGWLVYDGAALKIWTGGNAQCPLAEGLVPILTCDVWEHAYYLDHQNRRPDYLKTYWDCVNWKFADDVLTAAMKNTSTKKQ